MERDFSLIKKIKSHKLYKSNVQNRDKYARKAITESRKGKRNQIIKLIPGQLTMFDYLEPKYKEELEYYDAMPCVIIFGEVNTTLGKRILGFNMHYYPPRMRYLLMDKIYEIFKDFYKKHGDTPLNTPIKEFRYDLLLTLLQKAKLDFGVRMYIPQLIKSVEILPVNDWSTAVFTEGHFKKATRDAIMNYWQQYKIDKAAIRSAARTSKKIKQKLSK